MDKNTFWFGKQVLITGINGFIGGNLAKILLSYGAKIIGLVRKTLGSGRGSEEIKSFIKFIAFSISSAVKLTWEEVSEHVEKLYSSSVIYSSHGISFAGGNAL